MANGDGGDSGAWCHAEEIGEPLADRLVELQQAGVDELQHDGRRDDLGDAGDAKPVGDRDDVERIIRRPCAERRGVDEAPVDRHGHRCGPVTTAGQSSGDHLVEARPRRGRDGR